MNYLNKQIVYNDEEYRCVIHDDKQIILRPYYLSTNNGVDIILPPDTTFEHVMDAELHYQLTRELRRLINRKG